MVPWIFHWSVITVSFWGMVISRSSIRSESNVTMSETLNILLQSPPYDPRVRPNVNGPPVLVTTGFWILSIDSVSVIDMAFGIDIFLRQEWMDERLNHGLNNTLSLSNKVLSKVWLPDSYFKNAKKSNFHEVTAKNLMLRIGPNGEVHYNTRVSLKASCIMDLRLYPFDVQHCPLIMESYAYSIDHIVYQWEVDEGNGMIFVPDDIKVLPQFRLVDLQLSSQYTKYVVGNWSGVIANFTFQRTHSFYVIHIYGPSALIVILSWISFLLPREQAPARVTVGVTSVLTEVTILTMSNHAMPRVNYVKAIDKYLITCFLFVFASLLEYSLVLVLARRQRRHGKNKRQYVKQKKIMMAAITRSEHGSGDISIYHRGRAVRTMQEYHRTSSQSVSLNVDDKDDNTACKHLNDCRIDRDEIVDSVDDVSRKIFPLTFFLFNLYYWFCVFYYPYWIISK